MNPGSDIAVINHTDSGDTSALTNQDAVIIWGGTRDINRIDTQNGLRQINFMERHSESNVLVVSAPN
jgi:hypothetical protein